AEAAGVLRVGAVGEAADDDVGADRRVGQRITGLAGHLEVRLRPGVAALERDAAALPVDRRGAVGHGLRPAPEGAVHLVVVVRGVAREATGHAHLPALDPHGVAVATP